MFTSKHPRCQIVSPLAAFRKTRKSGGCVAAQVSLGHLLGMREKAKPVEKSPPWCEVVHEDQWRIYREAIHAVKNARAKFLVGGAFGLAAYIGRCRNTKDMDLFVLPSDKDRVVDALTKIGFDDYYTKLPYDRGWIYRATRDEVIVDTIWQTPNRRSVVDELWFERARLVSLKDEALKVLPPEELLNIKLYVFQRDRCDWPDLLNLLYAVGPELDWKHVLMRLGPEKPLLGGLLQVFNWVAPWKAVELPEWLRNEFCLTRPSAEELALDPHRRIDLLDSRPWFAAFQPTNQPMAV